MPQVMDLELAAELVLDPEFDPSSAPARPDRATTRTAYPQPRSDLDFTLNSDLSSTLDEPLDQTFDPTDSTRGSERSTADLVLAARAGDGDAYETLVARHERQVRAVVRGFRLNEADSLDAVQMTWLRLVENLHRLNDPERLGAWLSTTARRECLRLIRRRSREVGTCDDFFCSVVDEREPGPEQQVTQEAMAAALWDLVGLLPARAQELLRAVTSADRPAYAEIALATGMPIGSIGPSRGRYLDRLRTLIEASDPDTWR